MKFLKYRLMTEVNYGTEEQPDIQQILSEVTLGWSEANEKIAQSEAYNGEYTIEDVPDVPQAPTQLDAVEAQATYTAMMTNTILEG